MLNIITRYLCREILKSSAATVLILYVILMSNALGRVLSDIADGKVPQQAMWPVLLSHSVNIFSLLLPVGFFLGIVFAFGRLYKDNEITVMNACGMGYLRFYYPVMIVTVPLVCFSTYANLWLNSSVQRNAQEIVEKQRELQEFNQVRAGQFNQSGDGERVLYMESISKDRLELGNIIIGETNEEFTTIETARKGSQKIDPETGDLFLVVGPGKRYLGTPGENDFSIIEFEEHGILIEKKPNLQQRKVDVEEKSPQQLLNSTDRKDKAELYWRVSIPVVTLILALLAVPLAHISPRQGRFGKIGYAFLVYIVYLNLMAFSRSQIEVGVVPMAINFWWVHFIFMVLTVLLLLKRNRFFHRSTKRAVA